MCVGLSVAEKLETAVWAVVSRTVCVCVSAGRFVSDGVMSASKVDEYVKTLKEEEDEYSSCSVRESDSERMIGIVIDLPAERVWACDCDALTSMEALHQRGMRLSTFV